MPSSRTLVAIFTALFVATAVVPTALAGPVEQAAQLKAEGDAAFDARRYAEALDHYTQSLAMRRDARLHYNIAQALAALTRYPEALASYQAFIADAPAGTLTEAQQTTLFRLVEELKSKIARIEIACPVAGARVLVRGKLVGVTPLNDVVLVNAGPAKVEAIAEGHKPFSVTLDLAGAATQSLQIRLERVDFTGQCAVTSNVAGAQVFVDGVLHGTTPAQLRLPRGSHVVEVKADGHVDRRQIVAVEAGKRSELNVMLQRAPDYTLAYVGFGLGGAGIVGGTVTGILAYSSFGKAQDQCDVALKECGPSGQEDLRASKNWGLLSTVGFGVGAAGIALGSYGLLTAEPGAKSSPEVGLSLTPSGMQLGGAF